MSEAEIQKKVEEKVEETIATKRFRLTFTTTQAWIFITVCIIPAIGVILSIFKVYWGVMQELQTLKQGQERALAQHEKSENIATTRLDEWWAWRRDIDGRGEKWVTVNDHDMMASMMRMGMPPVFVPYMFEIRRK